MIASGWKDYEVLATGAGEKLERWGDYKLLRPDPQVIWGEAIDPKRADARYRRDSSGGGRWEFYRRIPDEWTVAYQDLRFSVRPMGFKHVGLFPEQAVNWRQMADAIEASREETTVLNLFAYTGGATVACAKAGAKVTHVDAARGMVDRARQNAALSGVAADRIRYIVDDCVKFVRRELKRGKRYNAVVMDPPSYGRGPGGETWKLEDDLFALAKEAALLMDNPLFFLINSYTTGLQPAVIENVLRLSTVGFAGSYQSYEICLPTAEANVALPCGCSGLWQKSRGNR